MIEPLRQASEAGSSSGTPRGPQAITVDGKNAGQRLDRWLVKTYPEHTRSFLAKLIAAGQILVEGATTKAGHRLRSGERILINWPPPEPDHLEPEVIDFTVLYEDEQIMVIVKPPGLVVHPAAGHTSGTLAHGLLHHCQELPGQEDARPGLVHRLDMDTSGIMLIAKTDHALRCLMTDFKERNVDKTYHAILARTPKEACGRLVAPLGRHAVNRKKMAIRPDSGKYAATRWRVLEIFANGSCFAEIALETGRTHQIRVHMASLGAPVLGDSLYGGMRSVTPGCSRQMLHASTLVFRHPTSGQVLEFTAPLWPDMQSLLEALRQDVG